MSEMISISKSEYEEYLELKKERDEAYDEIIAKMPTYKASKEELEEFDEAKASGIVKGKEKEELMKKLGLL